MTIYRCDRCGKEQRMSVMREVQLTGYPQAEVCADCAKAVHEFVRPETKPGISPTNVCQRCKLVGPAMAFPGQYVTDRARQSPVYQNVCMNCAVSLGYNPTTGLKQATGNPLGANYAHTGILQNWCQRCKICRAVNTSPLLFEAQKLPRLEPLVYDFLCATCMDQTGYGKGVAAQ